MGGMRKVKRSYFTKKDWKKRVRGRWGQMKIVTVVKKKNKPVE